MTCCCAITVRPAHRGNRRVPYRGLTRNNAWLQRRVAALNLRRLLALGPTHHPDTGWLTARDQATSHAPA